MWCGLVLLHHPLPRPGLAVALSVGSTHEEGFRTLATRGGEQCDEKARPRSVKDDRGDLGGLAWSALTVGEGTSSPSSDT